MPTNREITNNILVHLVPEAPSAASTKADEGNGDSIDRPILKPPQVCIYLFIFVIIKFHNFGICHPENGNFV